MTGLNKTDLPTSHRVQLAASALAGQGTYGAVTDLAQTFEVSRPTVYSAGQTADDVLTQYFSACEAGERSVIVDERQLERTIVGLRIVAPDSIRAIENLIPIVYPDMHVSYGKIQGILAEAEQRAADFNAGCDLSGIEAGALDEMFSQGNPVLAGGRPGQRIPVLAGIAREPIGRRLGRGAQRSQGTRDEFVHGRQGRGPGHRKGSVQSVSGR